MTDFDSIWRTQDALFDYYGGILFNYYLHLKTKVTASIESITFTI